MHFWYLQKDVFFDVICKGVLFIFEPFHSTSRIALMRGKMDTKTKLDVIPHAGATASSTCKACAAGTATSLQAQTSCPQCAAGKFQQGNDLTACMVCPMGKF